MAAIAVLTLAAPGCAREDEPAQADYQGPSLAEPTGSPAISRDGLVAAYDMDSGGDTGVLWDFGPHGHHGQIFRNQVEPAVHGNARRFTSTQDRVDLPEAEGFALDGPLTIAAWVRVDSLGLHQHIAACDDKWALWITPANQFRLGDTRGGGWSTDEGRVRRGNWTSVVAVLRGSSGDALSPETVTLWVDGEPASAYAHLRSDEAQETGAWGPGDLYPNDACSLGFESHQGNEAHQSMPFIGAVDDLLVFSRAWDDSEVRAFAGQTQSDPAGPDL